MWRCIVAEFPEMVTPPRAERLRTGDAAELIGVSRQRVQQLIRAGRFPKPNAIDDIGPLWDRQRIEKWAVEEWWGTYHWRTPTL